MVYQHLDQIDFSLSGLPILPLRKHVLLTTPAFFEVAYVINPHMADHVGQVNTARAHQQWETLKTTYTSLGVSVHVLAGTTGLPDMVFCANQTLPYLDAQTQSKGIFRSQMYAPQRRPEVDHYATYFSNLGHTVKTLPHTDPLYFEGMGDALWHPNRRLLWGGFGFRTSLAAYTTLSNALTTPVVALQLDDPDFYHLDTCLTVLDEQTALIYPDAFDEAGLSLIHHFFEQVLEAPEHEARHLFACNAHCPDQHHVIIQEGCNHTEAKLRAAGFEPVPIDTSEFIKAGGSVFCMKQMFWND